MLNKEFNLPETISEIHLGFLSGKHYIGITDIGKCKELDIHFKDRKWFIKVAYEDDNGNITYVEKQYNNSLSEYGIHEFGNK